MYGRFYIESGEEDKASSHLVLARKMISRMGYQLRDVDYQLLFTRFCITRDEMDRARKSLAKAKEAVRRIGYHHLESDVSAVDELLTDAPNQETS